jgi:hypothetical protein
MRRMAGCALALTAAVMLLLFNGCDFTSDDNNPNPPTKAILDLTITGGGNVVVSPEPEADGTYAIGTEVTLTAVGGGDALVLNFMLSLQDLAGKDFLVSSLFDKWTGDVDTADAKSRSVTVTLDSDKAITAVFKRTGVSKVTYPTDTTLYSNGPTLLHSSMTWDDAGRLMVSADWGTAQLAQTVYTYDADDRCTEYDFMTAPPNSALYAISGVPAITKYQYNAAGLVSEVDSFDSNSIMIRYITYGYNDDGKMTTFTEFDALQNLIDMKEDLTYNSLGQIDSVEIYMNQDGSLQPNGTATMTYDATGNVTDMEISGSYPQTFTLTYDADTGLLTDIHYVSPSAPLGADYVMEWQEL